MDLKLKALEIRKDVVTLVHQAKTGQQQAKHTPQALQD